MSPDLVTRVLDELALVHDPEVDQPITEMGFVREVAVQPAGSVVVRLQLPTYFCAPNFTWLMVDDARQAAERVVGPGRVAVELDDHFEADRIAGSVTRGESFGSAFGTGATEELDELRDRFLRKAFLIRQELLCREVEVELTDTPTATSAAQVLTSLRLGQVASLDLPAFTSYRTTREELGIDCRHSSPFLVAADGRPVDPTQLRVHRRSASVMAISFEGNGHLCRSLLAERVTARADHRALPIHVTRGAVA